MVTRLLLIASAACVLNLANGSSDPFPGFRPCKTRDDECLLNNVKKGIPYFADGIPALGVKRMDPVSFEKVDCSTQNLKFILKNVILTGFKTCKPLKVKRDVGKSQLILVLHCNLKLDGGYELDGKLATFPVKGNGKTHIHFKDIVNTFTLDYDIVNGQYGKKRLFIKKYMVEYELQEKPDIVFEGLFQNDKVLRQSFDDLIKNDGKTIVHKFGHKLLIAPAKELAQNINKFAGIYSYDEISLD